MEVEILDLSQKSISEKENDLPTAMDLSQKGGSVICVSEDEEDDTINDIISQINAENPPPGAIEACQKLLHKLGEKLRNEETLEILFAQMKMTQRRSNITNGSVVVNRTNGISTEGKSTNGCIEPIQRINNEIVEPHSPININDANGTMARLGAQSAINTTSTTPLGSDSTKAGSRMTREMAMQALDQQYMARKTLLRKQADKSLSEIPLARPPQGGLNQSDVNLVPSTTTNEFVALVGLEEVVKNLQEYRNVAMGQKPADTKLMFTPFNCVQCGTDFTTLWKRERPGSSSVVCESCCSLNCRKIVQKDYQEKIKLVLKKFQDQERDLDRDYKDMLDSPKKFELFRKEQEKKLVAMSGGAGGRAGASGAQHSQTPSRATGTHAHQATASTPATPQTGRAAHRGSSGFASTATRPQAAAATPQSYGHQQTARHQNSSSGTAGSVSGAVSAAASAGSQLSVDQLAYMQMFQALNQLGSSTTMNPQATRQQQQLMQQILQMAYMSSASTLLGGNSNNAAANSFVQLLSSMAGLVGSGGGAVADGGAAASGAGSASNTILNYYMSMLQQQQQASGNSDK